MQNELSGSRVRQLIEDHKHADKDAADDLLKAGSGAKHANNIPRDMLRKLSKRTAWPPLYLASIRVFDIKMQVVRKVWFPFILPHELIWSLHAYARDESTLYQHNKLCEQSAAHLAGCALQMGIPVDELVAVNLWGDGVPINFDRSQSLEVFFNGITWIVW